MKVIIRLLDAENRLLGWGETRGEMRGDGALWPSVPHLEVVVQENGNAAFQNAHWTELNVNASVALGPIAVSAGQRLMIEFGEVPFIRIGSTLLSLPAVTLRDNAIVSVSSAGAGPALTVH